MDTQTTAKKTTGDIDTIHMNITVPITSNQSVKFNKLNVMIGANGTGKTFMMVCSWALSLLGQAYLLKTLLFRSESITEEALNFDAQYIFDGCFTDQNIDGTIGIDFESGATVKVTFEKGKVIHTVCLGFNGLNTPTKTIYMSTDMRRFDSIRAYLKIRKLENVSGTEAAIKMREHYRLFDVMYVEGLLARMPMKINREVADSIGHIAELDTTITEIIYDDVRPDFVAIMADGTQKALSTYGAGTQSIINMVLAGLL